MKPVSGSCFRWFVFLTTFALTGTAAAQTALERARAHQQAGQIMEARTAVAEALSQGAADRASLTAAAELLDVSAAANRVDAYRRVIEAAGANSAESQAARRRLVLLYLQNGQYDEARREIQAYSEAGGRDLTLPPTTAAVSRLPVGYIEIPGPLISFQRMAALRPATSTDELLPALARNLVTFGYEYSHRFLKIMPSEYLKLLRAWVAQARELQALGGAQATIRISNCTEAIPVLRIIGYKLSGGGCASANPILEVQDPQRAFLTTDSGFPLVQFEEAVQGKQPFEYSVKPIRVPVMLGPEAWQKPGGNWVDGFLEDRMLARLYLAMSRLETNTAEALVKSPGLEKLKQLSPVLDFFGGMLRVENGRVVVPGGPGAVEAWKQLAGASPDNPSAFIAALLEKDEGWLAAYFDALSHAGRTQQAYYTQGARLGRLYHSLRGKSASPSPARPIFRGNAQLLLLTTRLRIQPNGRPDLPGGVGTWKSVFRLKPAKPLPGTKKDKNEPQVRIETDDEVVEALFSRVREADENGPVNVFLAVNEIDRLRKKPLEANTVLLLTTQYPRFSHHYSLFAEWPQLSSTSIEQFLDVAESLTRVREPLVRADGLGSFQASVALWEILVRQGTIPEAQSEAAFTRIVAGFSDAETADQVFDASRKAVQVLLTFAPADAGGPNDRMLAALSAPAGLPEAAHVVREEVGSRLRAALVAQRLISLDTLLALGEQLERATASRTRPGQEFVRMASPIKELNLPNPFPSAVEKNAAFFGYWTERHIDAERETDLARVAQRENVEKLARARGLLAAHLRDTLVGFVYAYYAPPGSMVMHNNPLFVRSHDFLGNSGQGTGNEVWGPGRVYGLGWPWNGGGRFVGSLSGIAYALADAEKDFLVPQQTQSLIWGELAPQIMVSAIVPRWWRVSARTQHYLALHLRLGSDLIAEASVSPETRGVVLGHLSRVEPRRLERLTTELTHGRAAEALRLVTPAELYRLSRTLLAQNAPVARRAGPAAAAIEQMAREFPQEASEAAVSAAYGVPHPKLARSFRPELLDLPLLPALLGYSSRLLAESWESSNMYWAQVADELALHPAELNRVGPDLTRRMLERIFANDLEDWPAVLNAMLVTADDYRKRVLAERSGTATAGGNE